MLSTDDALLVHVTGELDLATIGLLDQALLPLLGRGPRRMIVDASRLRFCDLRGYRALTAIQTIGAASGVEVSTVCPAGQVRRLIDFLQPGSSRSPLRVHTTLEQALAHN
ncbi:STAS domain-containing protein [Nonomuraea sp. NPDC050790]|uniref:STAS domain-containing protein n=1 Tax=Nonomuraea sp. NPDC050790 TaxID=3364371 RepID=UPI0037930ED8